MCYYNVVASVTMTLCLLQGSQWFGEDGQLKRLSSPLKEKPTRPPVINLEELDTLLQTERVKVCLIIVCIRFCGPS